MTDSMSKPVSRAARALKDFVKARPGFAAVYGIFTLASIALVTVYRLLPYVDMPNHLATPQFAAISVRKVIFSIRTFTHTFGSMLMSSIPYFA